MLKKVMSAVLAMFVCSCAIGFIGSASNECDYVPPGRQRKRWDKNQKKPMSSKKQDEDSKYSDSDDSKDGEFNPDEKNVAKKTK